MASLPAVPWHIFSADLQALRDEAQKRRNQPLADTCAAASMAMQASAMAIQNRDIGRAERAEADASEALWQAFTVAADTLRGSRLGLTGIAGLGKLAAANLMLQTQVPVTCSMLKKMIAPASSQKDGSGGGSAKSSGGGSSSSSDSKEEEDVHMRVAQTLCSMLCSNSARNIVELPLSVSLLLYCTTPFAQVQAATLAAVIQVTEPILDHLIPDNQNVVVVASEAPNNNNKYDDETTTTAAPHPHLTDGSAAQVLHMRAVYFLRDCFILAGWTAANAAFSQPLWLKLDGVPSHNKHLLSSLCLDLLLNFFAARDVALQQYNYQQQSAIGHAAKSDATAAMSSRYSNNNHNNSNNAKLHNGSISKSRLSYVAAVLNSTFVPVFCASAFSPSQEIFSRFHRLVVAIVGQLWPLFEPTPLHALLSKNEQLALGGGGPVMVVDTVSIPSTEAGWRVLSVVAQWRRVIATVGLLPRLLQREYDANFSAPELRVSGMLHTENYKKQATAAWQRNPLVKLMLAPAKVLEAMVSAAAQQQHYSSASPSPARSGGGGSSGAAVIVWAPELVGVLVDFTTTLCQAIARWFCGTFKDQEPSSSQQQQQQQQAKAGSCTTGTTVVDGTIPKEAAHALFDVIFNQLYCCFALALSRLSGEDVLHSALKSIVHLVTCACVVRHAAARDALLVLLANELRRADAASSLLSSSSSSSSAPPNSPQRGDHASSSHMDPASSFRHHSSMRARMLTERKIHILNTVVSIANGLGNDLGHSWRTVVQCFLTAQDLIAASQQHADRESAASGAGGGGSGSNTNSNSFQSSSSALASAAAAGLIVDEQELRSASFAMEHLFENTSACFSNEALFSLAHFLAQGSADAEDESTGLKLVPRDPLLMSSSSAPINNNADNIRDRSNSKSPSSVDGRNSPLSPSRMDSLNEINRGDESHNNNNHNSNNNNHNSNNTSVLSHGSPGAARQMPSLSQMVSGDCVKFILNMFMSMLRCAATSPVLYNNANNNNNDADSTSSSSGRDEQKRGSGQGGDEQQQQVASNFSAADTAATAASSSTPFALQAQDTASGVTLSQIRFMCCIWPAVRTFVAAVCRSSHLPASATRAAVTFSADVVSLLNSCMETALEIEASTSSMQQQQQQPSSLSLPRSPSSSSVVSNNSFSSKKVKQQVTVALIPSSQCAAMMSLPLHLLLDLFQRSDSLFCANVECSSHVARRLLAHEALRIVQQHGSSITGDGWQQLCRVAELSATVSHAGNDTEVLTTAFRIVELVHHGSIVQLGPLGLIKFIACVGAFVRQQVSDSSLSVNLSAVHIAWSVADFIVQQQQEEGQQQQQQEQQQQQQFPGPPSNMNKNDNNNNSRSALVATPKRQVSWASLQWDALLIQLRDGGCDPRPEIRQSSLRSLFAVVSTHGLSMPAEVWATCVWDVLLQVVDRYETDIVNPLRSDGILSEDGARVQARKIGAAGGESAFFFGRADQQTSVSKKSMPEAAAAQERSSRRAQWLEVYISLLEGLPRVIMKFVDFISRHAPNSHKVFGRLVSFAATALLAVASEAVSVAAARLLSCLLSELAPCPAVLDNSDFDAVLMCLGEVAQRCQTEKHFTLNVLKSLVDSFAPALRNLAMMIAPSSSSSASSTVASPVTSAAEATGGVNGGSGHHHHHQPYHLSAVAQSIAANSTAVPERLFGTVAARAERAQRAIERFVSFVEAALNSEAIAITFMFPASLQTSALEFADGVAKLLASENNAGSTTSVSMKQQNQQQQQQTTQPSPLAALLGRTGGVASAWLALQQLFLSRVPSPAVVASCIELSKKPQNAAAIGKLVERGCQPVFVAACLKWLAATWALIDPDSRGRLLPEILHASSHCVPLASLPPAGSTFVCIGAAAATALQIVVALSVPRMAPMCFDAAELLRLEPSDGGVARAAATNTADSGGPPPVSRSPGSHQQASSGFFAVVGSKAGCPAVYVEMQLKYDLASPPKFLPSQHTSVVKNCVASVTDALAKSCSTLTETASSSSSATSVGSPSCLHELLLFCDQLFRAVFEIAQLDGHAASCVEQSVSRILDGFVTIAGSETAATNDRQQQKQDDPQQRQAAAAAATAAIMFPLVEKASSSLISAFGLIDASSSSSAGKTAAATSSAGAGAGIVKINPKLVEEKVMERTEKLIRQYLGLLQQQPASTTRKQQQQQHHSEAGGAASSSTAVVSVWSESSGTADDGLANRVTSCLAAFVPLPLPVSAGVGVGVVVVSEARKSLLRRVATAALPLISRSPDANVRDVVQQLFAAVLTF